jgi:multicomponent Na+:H+ antiporter subunit B
MKFWFGSLVLDAAARLIAPAVLLYAVYVVAHGHTGPGGGFQGGVLFAAGLILVKLVRGSGPGRWEIRPALALVLACSGVIVYGGIGLVALAFGGNYLDYSAPGLLGDPVTERIVGTVGIEVAVALTVAGVILLVFDALAAWDLDEEPL